MRCVWIWLFFSIILGCRTRHHEGPPSDHFDGSRFFQPGGMEPKNIFSVLRWRFLGDREDWPESVANTETPELPDKVQDGEVFLTFVNQATLLIQLPGLNILTDPIWSERVSPVSWAGPKRVRPPGLPYEKLPPIHVVLVSHNHYDHLDLPTLQRLARDHHPQIFVPLGDKTWLEKEGVTHVRELDWGQSVVLSPAVKLIFTPSQHWSARGLFDRNRSLWGSYLLEFGEQRIYFAGDTGYGPHFRNIQKDYGKVWLALLPIGAYEPRWFMQPAHINPAEAVQAHEDLGARLSLGIHYGTWQLSDEGIDQPIVDLNAALQNKGLPRTVFEPALVGKTYRLRPGDPAEGG
ncbi:MBL fold metallo-hydrolase [Oligoflexus tunisiensis]|uniref:MBL fold metallo-hydrolase n=1 Tax=Oligoflexus tunisiensis TaxID=708132 RepID=UPI000B0DBF86|nr:MBL fold metallo-hydrolase [Oligoflexus tunisiensis]